MLILPLTTNNPENKPSAKKGLGGKEDKGRGNCSVSFSLVQFFLPRVDINLICFLLWELAYCHICVLAHKQHQYSGHKALQKKITSKKVPLSKKVLWVSVLVCVIYAKNPVKIFCFIKSLISIHFWDTVEAD